MAVPQLDRARAELLRRARRRPAASTPAGPRSLQSDRRAPRRPARPAPAGRPRHRRRLPRRGDGDPLPARTPSSRSSRSRTRARSSAAGRPPSRSPTSSPRSTARSARPAARPGRHHLETQLHLQGEFLRTKFGEPELGARSRAAAAARGAAGEPRPAEPASLTAAQRLPRPGARRASAATAGRAPRPGRRRRSAARTRPTSASNHARRPVSSTGRRGRGADPGEDDAAQHVGAVGVPPLGGPDPDEARLRRGREPGVPGGEVLLAGRRVETSSSAPRPSPRRSAAGPHAVRRPATGPGRRGPDGRSRRRAAAARAARRRGRCRGTRRRRGSPPTAARDGEHEVVVEGVGLGAAAPWTPPTCRVDPVPERSGSSASAPLRW